MIDSAFASRRRATRSRIAAGTDHPDTLATRNNFAYTNQLAGDPARAIFLYEATLTDCRRVLSEGHPLIATVAANLEAARRERVE